MALDLRSTAGSRQLQGAQAEGAEFAHQSGLHLTPFSAAVQLPRSLCVRLAQPGWRWSGAFQMQVRCLRALLQHTHCACLVLLVRIES